MSAFLNTRMLAFDVESTGLNVESDRIVTATVVKCDPVNKQAEPTEWLVNPGIDIPAEATAIHGITTEQARENGMSPAIAVKDIAMAVIDAWLDGIPVVAFNAAYDLTLLDREMRRYGIGYLEIGGPVIDPSVIDRALDPYRKGKRTLADVCAHYGVTQTEAHSASGDALAAARLAWKLPRVFEEVRDTELSQLHEQQVEWRKTWATNFEAYLREQGKPESIDGEWPMRAFTSAKKAS